MTRPRRPYTTLQIYSHAQSLTDQKAADLLDALYRG
jgi:hypothetical protein